jgi:4-carboxymuconolactone decarboxylase
VAESGTSPQRYGRARWLTADALDPEQRRVYEAIKNGPRARSAAVMPPTEGDDRLQGPFNAMLFSPALGDAVQAVGAVIRYGTQFPDRVREIAILEVARLRASEYEWYGHSRLAAAIGMSDAELDAIRTGAELELPPAEALTRRVVVALVTQGDLAEREYGEAGLSELITLVGYYQLLALSLRVWRTPLPAEVASVFGGLSGAGADV